MVNFPKLAKLVLLIVVAVAVANAILGKISFFSEVKYGVTFSPKYARYLNLDWQKTYTQILDDLKVRNLRILGYWDILEPEKGKYDFAETDYLLREAGKRDAKVILVVGVRQPRWPECHIPGWARSLTVKERQEKVLQFIKQTVSRYKEDSVIWAWQVENEPLLKAFGEDCEMVDKEFIKNEVQLVRSLSKKPIIMTDSGELGFWVTSMRMSDIFGTTVYRQVHDKLLGYMTYPVPPSLYSLKSNLVRYLFAKSNQKTIIVELQAEPWLANGNFLPPQQQAKLFTTDNLKSYVGFAQGTGFDEVYLWGVEWWYFMAANGYPEYLDYARTLFK